MSEIPLCVDLDGTILRTDSLFEGLIKSIKINFFTFLLLTILRPLNHVQVFV
jgi:hypothetical protein